MINVKNIETESHEDLQLKDRNMEIISALASDYTSLFYLVLSTGELYLYNMQSSVAEKYENSFNYCDFENAKQIYCERDVYPEDRAEYLRKLELDFIRRKLNKNREYSFIYRMTSGDGYEYCEVKCIRIDREGKPYAAVVAYANVDPRVDEVEVNHPTAIKNVTYDNGPQSAANEQPAYDLSGRRIDPTKMRRGIIIQNGKKVIR